MTEAQLQEQGGRPLPRMRRVIAERLTISTQTIPQFSVTVAVDVTRLLALRQGLKQQGRSYSVTDFVLAATAQTLVDYPDVNSVTDGRVVWERSAVHLGIAVSIPGGLVVPVIRDAHRCSLQELHDQAASLVQAARERTLTAEAMKGATFTVSNLGMFGVEEFRAIVNPGESAILAVSSAVPTAVPRDDGAIEVRQIMKLTVSADHRLLDGARVAQFADALRGRLQNPESSCAAGDSA